MKQTDITLTKIYKSTITQFSMFKRCEKSIVFFIISNLILFIFSFGFLIGGANGANGITPEELTQLQNEEAAKQASGTQIITSGTPASEKISSVIIQPPASWAIGLKGLFVGLQWAAIAYVSGQLLGSIFGLDSEKTKALSSALAAGFGIGKFASVVGWGGAKGAGTVLAKDGVFYGGKFSIFSGPGGFLGLGPVGIGIAAGIVVFLATYKDTETETITFNCLNWQAPVGGGDCEKCNDAELPCSEYRCKSLGQSCELLNKGTEKEACVWVNPRDVTPPIISPDISALTEGYKYIKETSQQPPGPGFKILGVSKECIPAFTPLTFGIYTDEPAQCKIDYEHKEKFEDMTYFFGSTNLYLYNHTEIFSLPGPANLAGENITLENGGNWTFFVRCQDKNGNANEAEYAVRFCVDPSPDRTAPIVAATSILDGSCIAEGRASAWTFFYTNEPANCKWSYQDEGYGTMDYNMQCSNSIYEISNLQLYTCQTNLTGIGRETTKFYIRCEDQPKKPEADRNRMAQSFEFNLKGSVGLKLKSVGPNETIFSGLSPAKVELTAETIFGCDGNALCYFSDTDNDADYVQFFETGEASHKQELQLTKGSYIYYIKCIDSAGNIAKDSVDFNVEIDEGASAVARFFKDGTTLKIITVRNSECAYVTDDEQGCDFLFDEGQAMPVANSKEHVAEWKQDRTYYIKCRDKDQPESVDCSVIIEPSLL